MNSKEPSKKKEKNDILEKCVVCGKSTEYTINSPIKNRKYYIQRAGQLCQNCYFDLYVMSGVNNGQYD